VTSQSYGHHAYHPVPTYIATLLALTALVLLAGAWLLDWDTRDAGLLAVALALWPLIAISRWYVVSLQDRIIQLEMQVRCARVLPAGEDDQLMHLSPKQIVALRFASDDELGDLLTRAVREQMTPDAIKRAVKQWRADLYRV
jgi:hypothetical protein